VQIGGAARAVPDLTVKYAIGRVRSGRTLDRFQVVLPRLAADATTVSVAADAVLALPHR
jgi:hypothetical protein